MSWNLLLRSAGTIVVHLDMCSTGWSRNVSSLLTFIQGALEDLTLAGENVDQVVLLLGELIPLLLFSSFHLTLHGFLENQEDLSKDGLPSR